MLISKSTSTSRFDKLYFGEKLFTTVGATKKGDHSFCMTRQIGIFVTYIKFVKICGKNTMLFIKRIFHLFSFVYLCLTNNFIKLKGVFSCVMAVNIILFDNCNSIWQTRQITP